MEPRDDKLWSIIQKLYDTVEKNFGKGFVMQQDFWSWRSQGQVAAERIHMDGDFWMTRGNDGFNLRPVCKRRETSDHSLPPSLGSLGMVAVWAWSDSLMQCNPCNGPCYGLYSNSSVSHRCALTNAQYKQFPGKPAAEVSYKNNLTYSSASGVSLRTRPAVCDQTVIRVIQSSLPHPCHMQPGRPERCISGHGDDGGDDGDDDASDCDDYTDDDDDDDDDDHDGEQADAGDCHDDDDDDCNDEDDNDGDEHNAGDDNDHDDDNAGAHGADDDGDDDDGSNDAKTQHCSQHMQSHLQCGNHPGVAKRDGIPSTERTPETGENSSYNGGTIRA